jgi:hypothetical protein
MNFSRMTLFLCWYVLVWFVRKKGGWRLTMSYRVLFLPCPIVSLDVACRLVLWSANWLVRRLVSFWMLVTLLQSIPVSRHWVKRLCLKSFSVARITLVQRSNDTFVPRRSRRCKISCWNVV